MGTHPIFESDFDCLTDAISVDFELIPDPDYEKKKSGKISSSAVPDMSSSDEDQSDEDEKPDFEQHLKWIIREEDGRSRRLKEQAAKFCHDINKLRERTNNRQRDLDSIYLESFEYPVQIKNKGNEI